MSSNIQLVSEFQEKGVYIAQFKTNMLAVFSYYVESDHQAVLIDPTYDYFLFNELLQKRKATLKFIVLTHYHADFISGHTQFQVPIIMGPGSKRQGANFQLLQFKENQNFKLGKVQIRVISTPGHTPESSCYILSNEERKQFCIFTGDTVFINEVGRPDLAVKGTMTVEDLAGQLYESIQKLKTLDGSLRIYPGHGSGSACGKSIGAGNYCELRNQCQKNYAFLIEDKNEFIQKLTNDLTPPPPYFFYDAKMNQKGVPVRYEDALKKSHIPLTLEQVQNYYNSGVMIIDTRHVPAQGIIKGSYWVTSSGSICQLISHVMEPQKQFVVISEPQKRDQILQRFIRVGFSNILGFNDFDMKQWKGQMVKADIKQFQELDKNLKQAFIDVRNKSELIDTGMFEGALFIPISQLKNRLYEVAEFVKQNTGKQIVMQCKTGMRARLGASLMLNNGLGPVTVFNQVIDKVKEKGAVLVPFKEQ